MDEPTEIMVATARRAHGLAGELQLEPETDRPDAVFVPGRRFRVSGGGPEGLPDRLTLTGVRTHGRRVLAAFAEIPDRTVAERYRGAMLSLPPDELEALDEDEYFLHELVGMRVEDTGGVSLGRVEEVYDANGRVLLGVRREDGQSLMPFAPNVVTAVDRESGTITVEPPAGLLDL